MALPTSYTEVSLRTYIHDVLGAVADALDWNEGDRVLQEAAYETLFSYGTSDISTITGRANIRKLRCLARREAWRAVVTEVASDFDFMNEAGEIKRSQVFSQAQKAFAQANADALAYDDQYNVTVETTTYSDPYVAPDEDD